MVRDFKRFVAFFIPAVIWGFFHHSGTELFSFFLNVASAIFGFFAASKWITSAQAGNIVLKELVKFLKSRFRLRGGRRKYSPTARFPQSSRRVSVSNPVFQSTISCAMSSVISSSLCSSIQPCSREGRLYGRSSATISISCTRKHAAPGSRRTTGGLYSRASTRGRTRFRSTIGLLPSLYYWLMNVASFSSPLERLGGTNTGPFRYGFVPDERVATIAEPLNECGQ